MSIHISKQGEKNTFTHIVCQSSIAIPALAKVPTIWVGGRTTFLVHLMV